MWFWPVLQMLCKGCANLQLEPELSSDCQEPQGRLRPYVSDRQGTRAGKRLKARHAPQLLRSAKKKISMDPSERRALPVASHHTLELGAGLCGREEGFASPVW